MTRKPIPYYLRMIREKLVEFWYVSLVLLWTLAEILFAILEFVLHVLRIPHWH